MHTLFLGITGAISTVFVTAIDVVCTVALVLSPEKEDFAKGGLDADDEDML